MIDPRHPDYASTPVSADRARFHYAPSPLERAERLVTPAVTVVTPFYNTSEIFHETAACLLGGHALVEIQAERGGFGERGGRGERAWAGACGQSLQNFEWIIVNDGSTDPAALRVLEAYRALAKRDARVSVIDHAKNHGLPATRNTGWRAARGPLVFFLDSDDLIEPTTLEKSAMHLMCNPEFAFVKGYSVGYGAQEYLWSLGFHSRGGMLDQNLVTATTMVRRSVLHAIGGFDESIRRGMEDWEFWLRAAAHGHWGDTIPEYLDWYRRRDNQHAAWDNIAREDRRAQFLSRIRASHGHIFEGNFPGPERAWHMPFMYPAGPMSDGGRRMSDEKARTSDIAHPISDTLLNPLVKRSQRLLMILPWLRMGGADRFNLDLVRYLTTRAAPTWDVTIATTLPGHPWLPEFSSLTPDVFALDHLARMPQFPWILDHLIASRRPDVVMVSNSQLGYFLLPYLRSRHPETTFVDFNHMEEPHWQNGGHPRTGAGFQEQLDLSIVVSGHLKLWMCEEPRRADPERIEVCHINADSTTFRPDAAGRAEWRAELKIDDDTPVILYAARLCAQKQPMVFARTMELLVRGVGVPPVGIGGTSFPARDLGGTGLPARDSADVATGAKALGAKRTKPAAAGHENKEHGQASARHEGREHGQDAHATERKFVALIAGDGEYYSELETFIKQRGLHSSVRMLGAIPAAKMPSLMAAADIFFLPSQWEGIALSIYEAMAAGLCVVGADVGGQAELVTPTTGVLLRFLKRSGEHEAVTYASTLSALIADPERIFTIGAAARARIREHFELDSMGTRMLAHFAKAQRLSRQKPRQAISEGFARELALQGMEMMRVQELADDLWPYRQKYLDLVRGTGVPPVGYGDSPEDNARNSEAAHVLTRLERSRTWRAIQMVKSSPPYKLLARARFGADWQLVDPKEPPAVRLARLRSSRAYRIAHMLSGSID